MKNKLSIRYQMSLLCYLLCSSVIYNPLYPTTRPLLCCVLSLGVGMLLSAYFFRVFSTVAAEKKFKLKRLVCAIAFISLCLGAVSFIGLLTKNFKVFSGFYDSGEKNLIFAILLLFVCAYISHKKSDGLFRLCQLLLPAILFYYAILSLSPVTTKNIILPSKNAFIGITPEAAMLSAKSILYLFSDIALFHFAFDPYRPKQDKPQKLITKQSIASPFVFSLIMIFNRLRTSFTFGETLTRNLSFCDLASIKLLPYFSFPEIYLLFVSFACTVKISVYIRCASKLLCIICSKSNPESIKNDSYICAFFCLVLSTLTTRLLSSFSSENSIFFIFVPISSFFIILLYILSSPRQNKS